jgi:hypothetical protein
MGRAWWQDMTVERAARAIFLARAGAMNKVDARILARAALGAIREPTPEMIAVASEAIHCPDIGKTPAVKEAWQAVIDWMLKRPD